MKQIVNKWLGRYFGNEEAVLLAVMLLVFMFLLATVGTFLGPFFAALIIAFLLQIRNIAFQGGPEMASWRPTLRHSFERELDYEHPP